MWAILVWVLVGTKTGRKFETAINHSRVQIRLVVLREREKKMSEKESYKINSCE